MMLARSFRRQRRRRRRFRGCLRRLRGRRAMERLNVTEIPGIADGHLPRGAIGIHCHEPRNTCCRAAGG